MRAYVLLALGALAAPAACSVSQLDATGKQCPCAEGYVCDAASSTCISPSELEGLGDPDGDLEGSEPAPAPLPPLPTEGGRITITNFAPVWSTPRQVRWEWSASGDPAEFGEYQIRTGARREELESPETVPGGKLWTKSESSELGFFDPRATTTPGTTSTVWSATFSHLPDSEVFAQVFAIDSAGRATKSDIVSVRTRPSATKQVPLFHDNLTNANAIGFERDTSGVLSGSACLRYDVRCPEGQASCTAEPTPGVEQIGADLSQMTAADFEKAFLEIGIGGDARVEARFSNLTFRIGGGGCSGAECRYRYLGFDLPPPSVAPAVVYRRMQIPLSFLRRGGSDPRPLVFDELAARNKRVFAFYVGGDWRAGSALRVDAVRVRW
jgi:hypothetical protein